MKILTALILTALVASPLTLNAKEANIVKDANKVKPQLYAFQEKPVKLKKLIDKVSKNTGKKFLVHRTSYSELPAHGVDVENISFNELLMLVDLNQMAAVEIDGVVNIVSDQAVKQYPIPLLGDGERVEHESLWVTKVIHTGNSKASSFIPILRTLVRTRGHMASHDASNSIVLVAPYGSVLRIENIIKKLQANTELKAKS